jgi:beta-galactosidase GanA
MSRPISTRIAIALVSLFLSAVAVLQAAAGEEAKPTHSFAFGGQGGEQFLLDGKPFQLIGGEMHPSRIPAEYWRHRIRMAKAMGVNTVPICLFWNDYEREEGKFDFTTGCRNTGKFLKIAREEGVWVVLRPGPYACGEWDFGGIPLEDARIASLPKSDAGADRPGGIFKGRFRLDAVADTFIDMSKYEKGVVWINGRNLGRYWNIGPQQRLYCPASWLKKGDNEIIILDRRLVEPQPVVGAVSADRA